tara:strand:+ start:94 stop:1095 length:1002 start_codon:yes stop_codon:yes gene_type:complete
MSETVHIIIPAINFDNDVSRCLKEINKISSIDFFVTVVFDRFKKIQKPKYKYKLNFIFAGKINMSLKRNIAAKKYKSEFIAFIDSDAYPDKNWLKNALNILKKKNPDIVGGPNIPFPKPSLSEKICHFSKRSYFVTGYQNFRKYKAKARYCDWLESCNFILKRSFFLKHKGMNSKLYTGEDKEFFERVKNKNKNFKVFYSPNVFVYHKERKYIGFLLQRLTFGIDFINLIKLNVGGKGFQPVFPLLFLLSTATLIFLPVKLMLKILIISILTFGIFFTILFEISKYVKTIRLKFLTVISIGLANLAFAIGSFLYLLRVKRSLISKIYILSKKI